MVVCVCYEHRFGLFLRIFYKIWELLKQYGIKFCRSFHNYFKLSQRLLTCLITVQIWRHQEDVQKSRASLMYCVAKHCHIPGRTKTEVQIHLCCAIITFAVKYYATNILLYLFLVQSSLYITTLSYLHFINHVDMLLKVSLTTIALTPILIMVVSWQLGKNNIMKMYIFVFCVDKCTCTRIMWYLEETFSSLS